MVRRNSQVDPNQMNVWFLLGFASIALLFVPAFVLMLLYILGQSNALNGLLQQYFHVSSRPDVPWWAALRSLCQEEPAHRPRKTSFPVRREPGKSASEQVCRFHS